MILERLIQNLKNKDKNLSVTKYEVSGSDDTQSEVTVIGTDLTKYDEGSDHNIEERRQYPVWKLDLGPDFFKNPDDSVLKNILDRTLKRMHDETKKMYAFVADDAYRSPGLYRDPQSDQKPQLSDEDLDYMVNNITNILKNYHKYRDKKDRDKKDRDKKGGKKRYSSNILKTSSSRRRRRSSKKRATKRKSKRRQRRASRRAY
jgi:hypothetical protein